MGFRRWIYELVLKKWSQTMVNRAQNMILDKAIDEGLLEPHQKKWVLVFPHVTNGSQNSNDEDIINLLWYKYNLREFFINLHRHRLYIKQTYHFLRDYLPIYLPYEILDRHDLTKMCFNQAMDFTKHYIHGDHMNNGRRFHKSHEPHHPQFFNRFYNKDTLQLWIDAGSCRIDVGNDSEMHMIFLVESFVDIIARKWEKHDDRYYPIPPSFRMLVQFLNLDRYSYTQKNELLDIISYITYDREIDQKLYKKCLFQYASSELYLIANLRFLLEILRINMYKYRWIIPLYIDRGNKTL